MQLCNITCPYTAVVLTVSNAVSLSHSSLLAFFFHFSFLALEIHSRDHDVLNISTVYFKLCLSALSWNVSHRSLVTSSLFMLSWHP